MSVIHRGASTLPRLFPEQGFQRSYGIVGQEYSEPGYFEELAQLMRYSAEPVWIARFGQCGTGQSQYSLNALDAPRFGSIGIRRPLA
jgi:hypothetical protein